MESASREICWTHSKNALWMLNQNGVFFAKYDGAKCRGRRLTWRKTVDSLCSNLSTKQADNHQRWRWLAATTEPQGRRTEGSSLLAVVPCFDSDWLWHKAICRMADFIIIIILPRESGRTQRLPSLLMCGWHFRSAHKNLRETVNFPLLLHPFSFKTVEVQGIAVHATSNWLYAPPPTHTRLLPEQSLAYTAQGVKDD